MTTATTTNAGTTTAGNKAAPGAITITRVEDIGGALTAIQTATVEELDGIKARLVDAEQRLHRRPGPSGNGNLDGSDMQAGFRKAYDTAMTGSLADVIARRQGARASIDLPDGYFAVKAPLLSGPLGQTERVTGIIAPSMQRLRVRDLLACVPTSAASIEYVVMTGMANAAVQVAEGDKKPETTFTFELRNAPTRTIAHYAKASTQILSDFPALQSFIDTAMRHGLATQEESQLLFGDGTGQNLLGLMVGAPVYVDAIVEDTNLDAIRRAKAELEQAGFSPNGVVMSPMDFAAAELLKDADGNYIIGKPSGSSTPMLWNMPVIVASGLDEGKYLLGDFQVAATLYDRWVARVEIATQNEDDFVRNLITIRCESRLALTVTQPTALRQGTLKP